MARHTQNEFFFDKFLQLSLKGMTVFRHLRSPNQNVQPPNNHDWPLEGGRELRYLLVIGWHFEAEIWHFFVEFFKHSSRIMERGNSYSHELQSTDGRLLVVKTILTFLQSKKTGQYFLLLKIKFRVWLKSVKCTVDGAKELTKRYISETDVRK